MLTVSCASREYLIKHYGEHNTIETVNIGSVMNPNTFKEVDGIYYRMIISDAEILR